MLNAFLRHRICSQAPLRNCGPAILPRTETSGCWTVKPSTLKRELAPLHNMFELAKDEWGLPLRENPLSKVRLVLHPRERETKA